MTQKAYVYEVSIDGVVRYIGKGRGKRAHSHLGIAARLNERRAAGEVIRVPRFYNALAKALRDGKPIAISILADGLTDREAFELEIKTIASMPADQLYNVYEGGQGMSSSDATKHVTKLWADPGYRAQQAEIQKDRAKYVAALWDDPEFRERHKEFSKKNMKRLWSDEEFRELQRKGTQEKWADPEYREMKTKHNREIAIAVNARPEKKRQQSQLIKKMNADQTSEFNERRVNGQRIAFQVRKLRKILAQMQEAYARGI